LLGFFDKDMLQLLEFERFLFDHGIPRGGQALKQNHLQRIAIQGLFQLAARLPWLGKINPLASADAIYLL
jgi:hypothetical protein